MTLVRSQGTNKEIFKIPLKSTLRRYLVSLNRHAWSFWQLLHDQDFDIFPRNFWASWYFCWQTAFRSVKSWRFRRLSLIIWSVAAAGGASIPFKRPSVRAVRFRRRFSYIQIFAAVCPSFNRYLSFACLSFNIASSYNPFNQIYVLPLLLKILI